MYCICTCIYRSYTSKGGVTSGGGNDVPFRNVSPLAQQTITITLLRVSSRPCTAGNKQHAREAGRHKELLLEGNYSVSTESPRWGGEQLLRVSGFYLGKDAFGPPLRWRGFVFAGCVFYGDAIKEIKRSRARAPVKREETGYLHRAWDEFKLSLHSSFTRRHAASERGPIWATAQQSGRKSRRHVGR